MGKRFATLFFVFVGSVAVACATETPDKASSPVPVGGGVDIVQYPSPDAGTADQGPSVDQGPSPDAAPSPEGCSTNIECADGNPCTDDLCVNGLCDNPENTAPCNDGNPCTFSDACFAGSCTGKVADCNDSNPCTDESCATGIGCVFSPNQSMCSDGDPNTTNDTCMFGGCFGEPPTAGFECSSDAACDDGNACNGDEWCSANFNFPSTTCQAGAPPNCNDNIACTVDSCAPSEGCVNTPSDLYCKENVDIGAWCVGAEGFGCAECFFDGQCADNDPCTLDLCIDFECAYAAAFIDADGEVKSNEGYPCDDGDACTTNDVCLAGVCTPINEKECNDGNSCTFDVCDPAQGCLFVKLEKQGCPGVPPPGGQCVPVAEVCNSKDDDCDGFVDEGCPGAPPPPAGTGKSKVCYTGSMPGNATKMSLYSNLPDGVTWELEQDFASAPWCSAEFAGTTQGFHALNVHLVPDDAFSCFEWPLGNVQFSQTYAVTVDGAAVEVMKCLHNPDFKGPVANFYFCTKGAFNSCGEFCTDGVDNDADGKTDCVDPDCASVNWCK